MARRPGSEAFFSDTALPPNYPRYAVEKMGSNYQCFESGCKSTKRWRGANRSKPLMALTKILANENAGFNLLVNGLLVGRIRSDQWERRHAADTRGLTLEEWYEDAAKQLNIDRFGTAQEFANVATFLASDAGSYINGTAINVDGGSCPVV